MANDPTITNTTEMLRGYVNDMLAVERELHQTFRRQRDEPVVQRYPQARELIALTESTIDAHLSGLQRALDRLGGDESLLKKTIGAAMGVAAGFWDKVRQQDQVSRMLRDDYAALTFASVCYELLHTTAVFVHDQLTADLALQHLRDYAPLVVQLGDQIPMVVARELADQHKVVFDDRLAEEARRHVRDAWAGTSPAAQTLP